MDGSADWFDPLVDEIRTAADSPDELAALFEHLRTAHGASEAGRRWWAAFGASDASAT
jgi:hypothetical protein